MTQLSRLGVLGIARETTLGTYLAPTDYLPVSKLDFEDQIGEIKDESIRANDTTLQGVYQGPVIADWSFDLMAYPDLIGHVLRGMIGPDTVTAGVSTTLSSASTVGATTISAAASIAAGTYVSIDTSTTQEYAKVTAVSGAGPYTLTVTTSDSGAVGLTKAHASGAAVVATTQHLFKQTTNPALKPTYSILVFDTLSWIGYTAAAFTDVGIKIDPKGSVTASCKLKSLPGSPQASGTPAYTTMEPFVGWEWVQTNAGGVSTRGLSLDLSLKRQVDPVHSSDGTQGPREIFQGAFACDGNYKAIFENSTDLDLFANYKQLPATAALQQPIRAGGCSLALTMSKSAWYKAKRDMGASTYVQAAFSISGIYNTADGGAVQASLNNFRTTSY